MAHTTAVIRWADGTLLEREKDELREWERWRELKWKSLHILTQQWYHFYANSKITCINKFHIFSNSSVSLLLPLSLKTAPHASHPPPSRRLTLVLWQFAAFIETYSCEVQYFTRTLYTPHSLESHGEVMSGKTFRNTMRLWIQTFSNVLLMLLCTLTPLIIFVL